MRRFAVQILSSYLEDGHLRNNVNAGWEPHAATRGG